MPKKTSPRAPKAGSIRIVGGSAGSRQIKVPSGLEFRPTTDRVREAMFNSLNSFFDIQNSCILDLFAGSGALGLEALSRGAAKAVFVDKSKKALGVISENAEALGFKAKTELICGDALKVIKEKPDQIFNIENRPTNNPPNSSKNNPQKFGVVFLDPPYSFSNWGKLAESLKDTTEVVIAESDRDISEHFQGWKIQKQHKYSNTTILMVVPLP